MILSRASTHLNAAWLRYLANWSFKIDTESSSCIYADLLLYYTKH